MSSHLESSFTLGYHPCGSLKSKIPTNADNGIRNDTVQLETTNQILTHGFVAARYSLKISFEFNLVLKYDRKESTYISKILHVAIQQYCVGKISFSKVDFSSICIFRLHDFYYNAIKRIKSSAMRLNTNWSYFRLCLLIFYDIILHSKLNECGI